MAKNIEYRDNTNKILALFESAKTRGLEAIGLAAEAQAKKEITYREAVDTGRLRNSITYALAGKEAHIKTYKASKGGKGRETYHYDGVAEGKKGSAVYIGTNVEYAPFVELGTVNMDPKPFLRPAAEENADKYEKLMRKSLENA